MGQKTPRGTKSQQEIIRKKAFQLFSKSWRNVDIAHALSISTVSVSRWRKTYNDIGLKGCVSKKRGPKQGALNLLSAEQQKHITCMIVDKCPDQLKLSFALWTRRAVMDLIDQEFGIKVAIRTIGDYLKRWGFSPQKPIKRAYERNDEKVRKWLDEEYPSIQKKAKQEKATIHWGDETSCVSMPANLRGYAPKGKTPILKHTAKKFKISMISTVTNQGKVRFMVYDEKMNATVFIRFLKRLIQGSQEKVFLILDNLRVHHAKMVKSWVEKNKEQIELFYLPAYSPDLNPDEYLNCDFKVNANKNKLPRNKEELAKNTRTFMKSLQRKPNRVKSYFEHKSINYAAS